MICGTSWNDQSTVPIVPSTLEEGNDEEEVGSVVAKAEARRTA